MKTRVSLFLAVFLFLGAGTALNAYLQLTAPGNPLHYPVPQRVLTTGPYRAGDLLITEAEKCNASHEAITAQGQGSYYRRLDINDSRESSPPGGVLTLGPDECLKRQFNRNLPALPPGRWRIEGQECVLPEKRWCQSWYTESFEVIP